jgi:hypothetical protein
MSIRNFTSSLVLLFAAQGFATRCLAATVATVSSKGSVTVSGIQVPTERLISWPISATDEIATGATPATIRFSDGSMLTLQKNSKVKLDASPAKFSLVSGSAILDGAPRTAATAIKGSANLPAIAQNNQSAAVRYNAASATAAVMPLPEAVPAYRSPGSQTVYISPNSLTTGTFTSISHAAGDPTAQTGEIILPSGLKLEVTLTTPGTATTPPTYTINSVLVPVTETSAGGVVTTTFISTPTTALTNATVTVSNPTQQTGTPVPVTLSITLPNTTTPVTPAQLPTVITTVTTTTITANLPTLPTGTTVTAAPTSPATINTFSPIVP